VSEHTGISWTHHTHNLWWGCEKVSPACDHCYAETLATRYGFDVWGLDKPRRFFKAPHYNEPLGWNAKAERAGERRRVFVNSMSDIGEIHPDPEIAARQKEKRDDYFTRVVPATPWLIHLLLTKRPANYPAIVPAAWMRDGWPSNVWPGITAENQDWLERRIEYLLRLKAWVHWISYEPSLGELDLSPWLWGRPEACADCPLDVDCDCGFKTRRENGLLMIGWLIAGGEGGAGFRDEELDWYRSARDQCEAAGIPFFFKQHSGLHPKQLGDRLDGQQYHQVPEPQE
jgi:protein gp37